MGRRHFVTRLFACLCFVLATIDAANILQASEEEDPDEKASVETSRNTASSEKPRRHFRMRQVADLEPKEASRIYELMRSALLNGYASSGFEGVDQYQTLKRYNSAPYLSTTHGNHYMVILSKPGNYP